MMPIQDFEKPTATHLFQNSLRIAAKPPGMNSSTVGTNSTHPLQKHDLKQNYT
jgi:hypothetical protein